MMKGHIQSSYQYETGPESDRKYRYTAHELGFPAFPGLSGAPVFRDLARQEVIALVTNRISYSTQLGDDATRAYWALGASLVPLRGWLNSL